MDIFQQALTAYRLWQKWGATATKADAIITDLQALDNGKFANEIEDVFLKHGVDLRAFLTSITAAALPEYVQTSPLPGDKPIDTTYRNAGQGANQDPLGRGGRRG